MRKKITDKDVESRGYKIIIRLLGAPVTTVAPIMQRFKVHMIVANLPGQWESTKKESKAKKRETEICHNAFRQATKLLGDWLGYVLDLFAASFSNLESVQGMMKFQD